MAAMKKRSKQEKRRKKREEAAKIAFNEMMRGRFRSISDRYIAFIALMIQDRLAMAFENDACPSLSLTK